MAHILIKLKDKYFVWSTCVDAPITYGLTREELTEYIREEHGRDGLRDLPDRMERVETKGTSAYQDRNVKETIRGNRAGPNETRLTLDQIYERYANEESEKNWVPAS